MPSIRWAFNVKSWKPSRDQLKLALECIQKEESERCYRFVYVEDLKSSMVGRLLMRKAVNESLGLQYDKVFFSRTSSGKPYLLQKCDVFSFNLSHHGDYCVLASEQDFNVGIDVMTIEHRGKTSAAEYFNLMKKQFSYYEWEYIMQPGLERDQLARFYRLWCLKESYVKAVGTGIVVDLKTISFSCPTSLSKNVVVTDTKLYENNTLSTEWKFEESLLDENHCIAVALQQMQHDDEMIWSNKKSVAFRCIGFEELTANSKAFTVAAESFWEDFQQKEEKTFR